MVDHRLTFKKPLGYADEKAREIIVAVLTGMMSNIREHKPPRRLLLATVPSSILLCAASGKGS